MTAALARARRRRLARRIANGTASVADHIAHAFLACGVVRYR